MPSVGVLWLMKHIEEFVKRFMTVRVYSNFTVAFHKAFVIHGKHCQGVKIGFAAINSFIFTLHSKGVGYLKVVKSIDGYYR